MKYNKKQKKLQTTQNTITNKKNQMILYLQTNNFTQNNVFYKIMYIPNNQQLTSNKQQNK